MLDFDLAELYHVETNRINVSVKNNPLKFQKRFCLIIFDEETNNLKSKLSTSNYGGSRKGHNGKFIF